MRYMRIPIALLALVAPVFLAIPVAAQPERGQLPPGGYEISYSDGLVTVRANEANVPKLLEDFSNKSGITFNKYLGKVAKISLDLRKAKVDEFLGKVLGSYVTKSKKKDDVELISSVTIMDEGSENPPAPPASAPREPAMRDAPAPGPPQAPGDTDKSSLKDRRRRPYRRRTPRAPGAAGRPELVPPGTEELPVPAPPPPEGALPPGALQPGAPPPGEPPPGEPQPEGELPQ